MANTIIILSLTVLLAARVLTVLFNCPPTRDLSKALPHHSPFTYYAAVTAHQDTDNVSLAE